MGWRRRTKGGYRYFQGSNAARRLKVATSESRAAILSVRRPCHSGETRWRFDFHYPSIEAFQVDVDYSHPYWENNWRSTLP